jgi:hypothetical protein
LGIGRSQICEISYRSLRLIRSACQDFVAIESCVVDIRGKALGVPTAGATCCGFDLL